MRQIRPKPGGRSAGPRGSCDVAGAPDRLSGRGGLPDRPQRIAPVLDRFEAGLAHLVGRVEVACAAPVLAGAGDPATVGVLEAEQGVGGRKLRIEARGFLELAEGGVALVQRQIEPPEGQPQLRVTRVAAHQPLGALGLAGVGEFALVESRVLGNSNFYEMERHSQEAWEAEFNALPAGIAL